MPDTKLIISYPHPTDTGTFERAYFEEHIPLVAPKLTAAGATKVVLTKASASPAGAPGFYRTAEIYFPSAQSLSAFIKSKDGMDGLAHATAISTGGPLTVTIAEEDTVHL